MQTLNFQSLIRLVTGRDFTIATLDVDMEPEREYLIFRILPITGRRISFTWKTPKTEDKFLRSFITTFTTKYREPNPSSYDYTYGGQVYTWAEKSEEDRENCYYHHVTHMYNKQDLLKQIEANFGKDEVCSGLIRYGFYNTEYGIGIFCFWFTDGVNTAINKMKDHLNSLSIPFTNEFSDARWVFRFKLGLTKETHLSIIEKLV